MRSTYWKEALTAGGVTSSVAAFFAAVIVAGGVNMVGGFSEQAVARAVLFPFAFYAALLTTLPASVPVALVVPRLHVWSVASVALLFCLAVFASSAASFVSDPLSLRDRQSLSAYFWTWKWAFCLFNVIGIISGSIGAFAAFEVTRRERMKVPRQALPVLENPTASR